MYNLWHNHQVFEGDQSSVEVEVGNYVLTIAIGAIPRYALLAPIAVLGHQLIWVPSLGVKDVCPQQSADGAQ
jgi:hypothetical protein